MSHPDTFLVARSPAVVCLFARKNSHRRILHSWNTVSPVGLYVLPLKNSQVTAVDDLRKYIFQKSTSPHLVDQFITNLILDKVDTMHQKFAEQSRDKPPTNTHEC